MKGISSALLTLFSISLARAQDVEMADTLRSDGKIYVVVAILVVILIGLLGYVFMIDRKATRLEKKLDDQKRP